MRVDIMTDIETLGTQYDSTVFQVSAVSFNIETGEILDTFNQIVDIEKENMIVDGGTIKWWLNTDKELLQRLICSKGVRSAKEVFSNFRVWMLSQVGSPLNLYLWGNGILFDNNMIKQQMIKHGLEYPIYHKNDRDMRTILELAALKSGHSESEIKTRNIKTCETQHNAIDDCFYQVRVVVDCYNMLIRGKF